MTFRRVVLPLVAAGDRGRVDLLVLAHAGGLHHVPQLVGNTLFIGNVDLQVRGIGAQRALRRGVRAHPHRRRRLPGGRAPSARSRRSRRSRWNPGPPKVLLRVGSVLTSLFLYIPLVIVVLYAFNN